MLVTHLSDDVWSVITTHLCVIDCAALRSVQRVWRSKFLRGDLRQVMLNYYVTVQIHSLHEEWRQLCLMRSRGAPVVFAPFQFRVYVFRGIQAKRICNRMPL